MGLKIFAVFVAAGLLATVVFGLFTGFRFSGPGSTSDSSSLSDSDSNFSDLFLGEADAVAVADWVVDGDTFDTDAYGRIRLADVDAPEYGESGFGEAKDLLYSLVYGKTVYLDIDDEYRTDRYGRLVCVVYVNYNSTHFKNVNKALLDSGVAVISNYDNEFSPYFWTLYCTSLRSDQNQDTPNIPSPTTTRKFVGSVNSNKYHYPSCDWAKQINQSNQIWFSSSADARAHGYRPCQVCNPP